MPSFDSSDNTEQQNIPAGNNQQDLKDNPHDEKVLAEDAITLDLPDVSDIPGQENIVPPKMGMFADTTISSDGEEGTAVFDENDDEEL